MKQRFIFTAYRFLIVFILGLVLTAVRVQAQEQTGIRLIRTEKKDTQLAVPAGIRKQWKQGEAERKASAGLKNRMVAISGTDRNTQLQSVRWIAAEQQLNIYEVKMSNWINKYIGETEKNLSLLFNKAAASNSVMFFDEADALFGKAGSGDEKNDKLLNELLDKARSYRYPVLVNCKEKNCTERFRQLGFEIIGQE